MNLATSKGYSVLKQFFLRKKNCARNTPYWLPSSCTCGTANISDGTEKNINNKD
jgi:hypothetical protein